MKCKHILCLDEMFKLTHYITSNCFTNFMSLGSVEEVPVTQELILNFALSLLNIVHLDRTFSFRLA
jgi:hypothetical protein